MHNIRFFFYAGGNDSQDTAHKIHLEAVKRGYDLRVMGVPKTIDNDLPVTDHCPGYGSVIKYNSATVMEIGFDVGSMATDDGSCCIVEVMGRAAGWIGKATNAAFIRGTANADRQISALSTQHSALSTQHAATREQRIVLSARAGAHGDPRSRHRRGCK